jgi:hypothetical protein
MRNSFPQMTAVVAGQGKREYMEFVVPRRYGDNSRQEIVLSDLSEDIGLVNFPQKATGDG